MKHLFIINPAAGKYDHTAEFSNRIRELCEARGLDFSIVCSKKPGDATTLTRTAAETGEELRIYACGGDGTLNEVVCGAIGHSNVAVTHFPGGSGNDFIKIFDKPEAFKSLEQLLDADEATFDVIRVGEDYSLNICSIGIDARIGTEIGKYKRLPLVSGKGAYNLSTVINLIKGIHHHYRVEVDGEEVEGRFTLICICNGRFYGGGYQPVPEADPADGQLELLLVDKVSRLQVAGIIGKYKDGRYAEYPELFHHFAAKRVAIHCDAEEVVNLDGEARYGKDVEIALADEKLRFFYPRGLKWRREKAANE